MPVNKRVLVVDFEPRRAAATAKWLEGEGYAVTLAVDAQGLDDVLLTTPPPVALIEPMLPGRDGFELCRLLKQGLYGSRPRVVLASRLLRGPRYKTAAQGVGADLFLERPGQDGVLLAAVEKLCELGPESAAPASSPSPVGNRTGANRIAKAFPRNPEGGPSPGSDSGSIPALAAAAGPARSLPGTAPPQRAPAASLSSQQSSDLDRMIDDVFNEIVSEDAVAPADESGQAAERASARPSATAVQERVDAGSWDDGVVEELSGPASGALSLGDTLHDDVAPTESEIERELSGAFGGEKRDAIPLSSASSPPESAAPGKGTTPVGSQRPARAPLELAAPVPGVEPATTVAGPATGPSGSLVAEPPAAQTPPARPAEKPAPSAQAPATPRSAEMPPVEEASATVSEPGGGRSKLIGALVAVLALVAVAVGAYLFLKGESSPAPVAEIANAGAAESLQQEGPLEVQPGPAVADAIPAGAEETQGPVEDAADPAPPPPAKASSPAASKAVAASRPPSASTKQAPARTVAKKAPPPAAPAESKPSQSESQAQGSAAGKSETAEATAPAQTAAVADPDPAASAPVGQSALDEPVLPPVSLIETEPVVEESSPVEVQEEAAEPEPVQAPAPATVAEPAPQDIGPLLAGVNGVSDPELIGDSRVPPNYPDRALQLGHRGKCRVILELMIGIDGKVKSMQVLQEQVPHMGFADSAMEAVGMWRFIPARLNGKPVEVKKTIVVNFDR